MNSTTVLQPEKPQPQGLWREHGEVKVTRNGNVAEAARRAQAQTETGGAVPPIDARALAMRCGFPEASIPFIRRMLEAEKEVLLLQSDIRALTFRVAALENKI